MLRGTSSPQDPALVVEVVKNAAEGPGERR